MKEIEAARIQGALYRCVSVVSFHLLQKELAYLNHIGPIAVLVTLLIILLLVYNCALWKLVPVCVHPVTVFSFALQFFSYGILSSLLQSLAYPLVHPLD